MVIGMWRFTQCTHDLMAAGEAQPSSAEEAEVWEGAEGDKQSNTDAEREHELSNTDWKQGGKN